MELRHNEIRLNLKDMWDNRGQSEAWGHLKWQVKCIKVSWSPMVECLGAPCVRVQGTVLSMARQGGNSCNPLIQGAIPTIQMAVTALCPPSPPPRAQLYLLFLLL